MADVNFIVGINFISFLCKTSFKQNLLNIMLFLFVVNMRIVGTDENLKPLSGKVLSAIIVL